MTEATSDFGGLAIPRRASPRQFVIAISLVLVVMAAAASLFIVQGVDAQMRDVQHTYEVRRQAHALTQALIDAETGQRGYLLTQDSEYLDPYRASVASLDATYRNLLELVGDNPAQKSRIGSLEESIELKRSEMATTITLATGGRLSEALSILRSDAGRALMDGIRQTLEAFVADEDARLIERNNQVDSSRLWLIVTIIVALAGAAILTFSLLTSTQQQVSTLRRTSSLLQSQNVELEERVRARTAELEDARLRAERERARVEALLQDTNHRIGNSLATVSSMLGLQVARTKSDAVRYALEAAQSRVHTIASAHRRLRLGDDLETTRVDEFLEAAVEDLRTTHAQGRDITIETRIEPLVIYARDATTIGIVVGELIINAFKHAFPDNGTGHIRLVVERGESGVPTLKVEDDGRGLPAELGPETGLGAMIVRQLASQYGGEPIYDVSAGGVHVTISLPKLEIVAATKPE